jgi:hypothetical protein
MIDEAVTVMPQTVQLTVPADDIAGDGDGTETITGIAKTVPPNIFGSRHSVSGISRFVSAAARRRILSAMDGRLVP